MDSLNTTALLVTSGLAWIFIIYIIRAAYKSHQKRKDKREHEVYKSNCAIIKRHW